VGAQLGQAAARRGRQVDRLGRQHDRADRGQRPAQPGGGEGVEGPGLDHRLECPGSGQVGRTSISGTTSARAARSSVTRAVAVT
jgi:hypothetical protein